MFKCFRWGVGVCIFRKIRSFRVEELSHFFGSSVMRNDYMILGARIRYPAEQQRLRVSDQNALSVYWIWFLLYGHWWRNV